MAKKNRVSSEAKPKHSLGVKKVNPFELQTSKTKFSVLNRDTWSSRQVGQSGVQRARAIQKRKQTLGQEFLLKHKSNKFSDQRQDGRNAPRHQQLPAGSGTSRRKAIYNLNDSVKLTHRGQTLEEIERFDEAVDNDDDGSDEDDGQLDAKFMEVAHFGGGDNEEGNVKDRKTVIEEMIAESKRKKAEKQRENDEVFEMTQQLDKNWQSLLNVVGGHMKSENKRPVLDDYDIVMREMIFERRGKPADKLKSEDELAKFEKEKRERLERERLARMNASAGGEQAKHRSADDLDDGYLLQQIGDNDTEPNAEDAEAEDSVYNPRDISKENSNGVDAADDGSDDEEGSEEESEESSDDEPDKDDLSDLKASSEDESELSEKESTSATVEEKTKTLNSEKSHSEPVNPPKEPAITLPDNLRIPRTYEEFAALMAQSSAARQSLILETLLKSNKAKNARDNKQQMISLFAFSLQHLHDCFTDVTTDNVSASFAVLSALLPHLFDLAHLNPAEASVCFMDVIKEKHDDFRKRPRHYPPLSTLVFLKLVPMLFSASDFRHSVVSPALVFLSSILSKCTTRNRCDVTRGLFLITTMLECVQQTKRILPAALNFLNGVAYMCHEKRPVQVVKIVPPFKSLAPLNNLLALTEAAVDEPAGDLSLSAADFVVETIDDSFKLRSLATVIGLIRDSCQLLQESAGIHYVADEFLHQLDRLDADRYPKPVKTALLEVRDLLASARAKPLRYLVAPERKPKPLRLLEPKIEPTYDDIRRRPKNQQLSVREQRKKLQQKVRKESRAAAREIRQDNEFLFKMRHRQRVASDRERREKVKRIFADASTQQGELKTLDRKAKYKK